MNLRYFFMILFVIIPFPVCIVTNNTPPSNPEIFSCLKLLFSISTTFPEMSVTVIFSISMLALSFINSIFFVGFGKGFFVVDAGLGVMVRKLQVVWFVERYYE